MRTRSAYIAALLAAVVVVAVAVPMVVESAGDSGKPGKPGTSVFYLSGTPKEMGLQYGSLAMEAISENIAQFWGWVAEQGMSKDALIAAALDDEALLPSYVVDELKGMSKSSGIPYKELLAFNKFGADDMQQHACTCFMAAGSATVDGRAISSKNRDLNNIQVLFIVEPENGYSYIGMMSAGALGVSQGINEKGVAIGHTWMPVPEYYEPGLSPFLVNQLVMEQCADLQEAVDLVCAVEKSEGATFIISDPVSAAFVETVPSVINTPDSVAEFITDGVAVHTNHYVLEPFYTWVKEDGFGYFWSVSFARYDRGLELLAENPVLDVTKVMEFTRDLEDWGCGSPQDVIAAHPEIPEDTWSHGWPGFSICNARTVSASVFCCDDQYPEELSTMWMAINNPAWCPYVPLHNGIIDHPALAGEMLSDYMDGRAWKDSMNLRSLADWGDLIPVFEDWEEEKSPENAENEADARALLTSGDVDGATLLLTEGDGRIAQDALDLMTDLLDGTVTFEMLVAVARA